MPQFIITYIGGNKPSTPEEGQQHFVKYKAWLSSLGESVVSPANPLGNTHTVNPDGTVAEGSLSSMSGYTLISVDSIDDAVSIAKACPFLEIGGSLEGSERKQRPV